ncbi:serine--tRNA ligase [Candidatus Shikimatogenerans bostrichidophilus]|uniref:serine--tRNA ligase n=1 Tax=Candidatus Shikimatogenerans bostrichidophilus TaxID=2943807 RepID=UPI002966FF3F
MLTDSLIKENKKKYILSLKKRKFKNINIIKEILFLYKKQKNYIILLEKYNRIINKYSKNFFKKNKIKIKYKKILNIKNKSKKLKNELLIIKEKIFNIKIKLPNIINELYFKKYKNIKNNKIIYKNKKYKLYLKKNKLLSHIELSKKFELFDTNTASKISGTGFVIYSGIGLKLYNSLVKYLLFINKKKGYKEYKLPYLVNEQSIYGTGQYPDKKNQLYNILKDNLYLIPTGEVPLINLYKNKIFKINNLPIKAQTYTNCFRREAGSYGKNVKGLNRLHQFGKVEIIEIMDNKNSNLRLFKMLEHIKYVLKTLKLYFRIILLSCNNIGLTSSITYDFEVYSFGQKKWIEVSSLSNCLDYQSNNLNIYYLNKNNKELCHTLNGSCISIPRLLLTIIEMYQTKNKIKIPKVLIPFYKNE